MLPTSGYFRGIPCPEHEKNYCHRPYCHFRHNPKKELTDATPQSSTSTPDAEVDGTSSAPETLRVPPASTNTETEIAKESGSLEQQKEVSKQEEQSGPEEETQSEILQHLVSEAVKKVLAENPLLASPGIDPTLIVKSIDTSALAAHAASEVSQANTKLKKKYYFRPPGTPSYNPTPIEELNKRKRSVDYNEVVSASKAKALKYTPAPVLSLSTIQDAIESEPNSKESVESEVTDFSSDETEDDVDKRKCDFDILEEVLAEHSQNNKIKPKKKKVKALGKLQYSLNIPDKKVDESSMISDARNLSDQDSNSCDLPVTNNEDKVPNEGSYFLPPSPVFTSSSDGFGAFNSVVYTKPSTSPDECESKENRTIIEKNKVQNHKEGSEEEESNHAVKQPNLVAKPEKKRIGKEDTKKRAKGHTHLPQVVHTLGAPKLSRPNVRSWTPRSNTSDSKKEGDPLEEMLQLMDGNESSNKGKSKGSSKDSPAASSHNGSPKNKTKYKVDLDKEIESLTNSSSTKKHESASEEKADLHSKESNILTETSQSHESEQAVKESNQVGEKINVKGNAENDIIENEKNLKMDMNDKDKPSESDTPDTESEEESNDGNSVDKTATDSDSEHEKKRHKKKRKRSPSSSSESDRSHHRKKRKKYHKRRRKHGRSKKHRKHRDRKSDSSDNEEELKDDKDNDDENKSDTTGDILNDENDKSKKRKKHKKKNKHNKKSKYKRKRGKSKLKKKSTKSHSRSRSSSRNRSNSSSSTRSHSSSRHRSRSSSKYQSRSSSGNRSRSSSKHRSRCLNNSRSKSPSKGRGENSSQRSRSRSRSKNSYTCKPRHKGESDSKSQNESSSKHRSRSSSKHRSRSSSSSSDSSRKYRSRSVSKNRSKSPFKGSNENTNQRNQSHSRSKNGHTRKSQQRGESDAESSSESSSKDSSRSSSRSSSKHRSRSLSRNRSKSPSKGRGENINRSRSHSRSKNSSAHKAQQRRDTDSRSQIESSSRHRSRSSSRHRSRSSSKCKSKSVRKNRSQSPSKGRGEKTNRRSRSCSRSKVSDTCKSQRRRGSNLSTKESQPVSTPMPIDPSKIKVEKEEIVPDLSIVKTEKVDPEESSDTYSNADKLSSNSEINTKSNDMDNKKIHLGNQKSSREGTKNLESFRRREKEQLRLITDKESKRRDFHERKNSTESITDKESKRRGSHERKNSTESMTDKESKRRGSHERKNSTESITDKESKRRGSHERKNSTESISEKSSASNRRGSIDSKKSDSEILFEKKKLEGRRTSTEKNRKEKVSSPNPDVQPKDMSMFDMVFASTQPSKPKSLTEISLFEAASNMHDMSADSSSTSSDDELDQNDFSDCRAQKSSAQKQYGDKKHNVSHSSVKSKTEQSSKFDKKNDHPKSETTRHSHKSNDSRLDATSKEYKSESKHTHSSSTKDKSSNYHISSSSHHSSSSSHHKSSSSGGGSSSSSKQHHSSSVIISSTSTKTIHSSNYKSKEGNSDITSSSHIRNSSKHSSDKHHHSSKSSSSKQTSDSHHKDKGTSSSKTSRSKKENKTEVIISKKTAKTDEVTKSKKTAVKEESSDGISDRDLYGYNDYPASDTGNESPLPDLSVLDEIPEDDWEQMISSSDKVNSRHFENLENFEESDEEDLDRDDPQVMEECMKMFNDYQPAPEDLETQPSSKKARMKSADEEPDLLPGKQRIARSSSTGNLLPKKPYLHQHRKTPTQMMMERYKKLKEQQAELMKQLEKQKQQLEEQSRGGSSSTVSSTTSSKPTVFPASSSTSIMSPPHSSPGTAKRRISHVPNVSSLLHAREKIKNLPPANSRTLLSPSLSKASGALPQTHSQTIPRGEKRIAHTAKIETLARPVIQTEFGSKVPQNIRQRYLNLFTDECLKFCGEKEAFSIAAAEECVCVKRASSRMVYLNLAVNAVKRLRTQQKAGEAAQELLDKDPQFAETLSVEEPSTSGISSSPSKEGKPHPTNPNHVKLSHFTVLAGGGQRGSWSIEKPKKNPLDIQDSLKGEAFYKHLVKYILKEEQLDENGYPCPDPDEKGKAIVKVVDSRKKISPSSVERYCDRCSVLYMVDKWGFPTSTGPCVYHWGRAYKRRSYGGPEARYSCCGGDLQSEGCCQAVTHVSQNYNPKNLHGYVRTLPKDIKGNYHGVYALDCEMCYTTSGIELTRVTVVNTEGNTVYENLVKPENPIIDYNTRFSGITESDLQDVKTTLLDVQAALLTRFSDKTILIGHSLESDFQALKLIHDTVVDTSVVFPHKMGAPYKRALRNLASEYLKKIIQNDVSGHDSAEDATTCMYLMQWKVKEDIKGQKVESLTKEAALEFNGYGDSFLWPPP